MPRQRQDAHKYPVKEKLRRSFFTVLQPSDRFTAVAPLQPHHEGEQRAALSQPEVVPEILHIVHLETRRVLVSQRRKIHAVAVAFVFRLNPSSGEEQSDANIFQIVHNFCFFGVCRFYLTTYYIFQQSDI